MGAVYSTGRAGVTGGVVVIGLVAAALGGAGCRRPPAGAAAGSPGAAAGAPSSAGSTVSLAGGGAQLTRVEAERHLLALVNRDREEHGLPPVSWDPVAARAGQRHAEDMAQRGFTAHWGSDGSVPEQRYSEAGGLHVAYENAACFFDGVARELDPDPRFSADDLGAIEAAFMAEKPPADGHRKNILAPAHTGFGVGLAKPRGVTQPCLAQEFVDQAGAYDPLPARAARRQRVRISGKVDAPLVFGGVGLGRLEPARPLAPAELNQTGGYQVPGPYRLHFPPGFVGPKPEVQVAGGRFTVELPLDDGGRAGRYTVSVWARRPGQRQLDMVSLRVIHVP